jgi:hypothetical protein
MNPKMSLAIVGAGWRGMDKFVRAFRHPLDAWSVGQLGCAALAIMLVSFAIAWHPLRVARDGRVQANRAAVAVLDARAGDTTEKIRMLPALRRQAASCTSSNVTPRDLAPQLQSLADAVTQAGLSLDALEPVDRSGGERSGHAFRLQASGDFFGALMFVRALRGLPVFAMADDVRIKANGARLLLDMRLTPHLHAPRVDEPVSAPAWRAVPTSGAIQSPLLPPLPPDPFAMRQGPERGGVTGTRPRLLGVIGDGGRHAALLAPLQARSTTLVRAGTAIESGRVAHIGPDSVTLVGRDDTRHVLPLSDEAR